jgi:ElaB/YqjD/DUF883 family membrane-anchored ribosome-binding protein
MSQMQQEGTRDKLIDDFNTVVTESEQLLKSVANASTSEARALRASLEQSLTAAKQSLATLQQEALERTRAAARVTDEYVHENPWRSIGVGAALAGAAGLVIGLLISRR